MPYLVDRGNGRKDREYEWKQIDNGTVTCAVIDQGVKKEHAIRALLSANCTKTLEAIDPKYTKECRPLKRPRRGATLGPTIGMLTIAIGGALWVRRRRERD